MEREKCKGTMRPHAYRRGECLSGRNYEPSLRCEGSPRHIACIAFSALFNVAASSVINDDTGNIAQGKEFVKGKS